jgi:hypothetical protein
MTNKTAFQFRYSYERDITDIYLKVSIGAAGAPTIASGNAKGVQSITRNSAGNYTILLQQPYNRLLDVASQCISGASPQAAPMCTVVSEAVATASAPTVRLQYRAIDNVTATDPASGEVLLLHIAVRNSSGQ